MYKNGNETTAKGLLKKREQLIQEAGHGKQLTSEDEHFLDLVDVALAKQRDEQAQKAASPFIEQLKKANHFVEDVFRDTAYFEFSLWCIDIPAPAGMSNSDTYGCWITTSTSMTYEEMCRLLENVKSEGDILALSTTPKPALAIGKATPRWQAEVEQLRAKQGE